MAEVKETLVAESIEPNETELLQEKYAGKNYAELMDLVDNGELTTEQLDLLMDNTDKVAGKAKKSGARKARKYEGDTKDLPCVVCGKMVTVTKFASPASVYCEEHKAEKVGRASKAKYDEPTKVCQCIDCGVDVTVTKFATPATVRCDECKAIARKNNKVEKVTILYTIENIDPEFQSLHEQKVFGMKNTLFDNVYEVTAQPALLTLLEASFDIVEFIESDAATE